MIEYKKIDISKEVETNGTSGSKECMLCHYWCFKNAGYKFKPYVCNKCHDVLMSAYKLKKNIEILTAKGVDYRYFLWGISKTDAVNILNLSVSEDIVVL